MLTGDGGEAELDRAAGGVRAVPVEECVERREPQPAHGWGSSTRR
ncbi:hypothetical protein AB0958_40635 [Streptomyces sp. NPDC006655]